MRVIFLAEKVDGVGNMGLRSTMMLDVETLLEAFLNMSLRCLFQWLGFFLAKSNTSSLGITLLKYQIIRISEL
jgi:hypothetical protein